MLLINVVDEHLDARCAVIGEAKAGGVDDAQMETHVVLDEIERVLAQLGFAALHGGHRVVLNQMVAEERVHKRRLAKTGIA